MIHLQEIKESFDKAFYHSFTLSKFLTVYISLGVCALLFVSFRQLAYGHPFWIQQILFFLPLFLGALLLYGAQLFLTQGYLRERERKQQPLLRKRLFAMVPSLMKLSYFLVPLVLFYLILLLFSGTFLLFTHAPFVGVIFKTLLAFVPFLLNIGLLGIFMALLFISFYIVPLLSIETQNIRKRLFKRMTLSPFIQFFYLLLPTVLLLTVWKLLMWAVEMSVNAYVFQESSLEVLLQSFSILIPFTALFTFPILFLWNFAAESALVVD